jgi:hypothetical protein
MSLSITIVAADGSEVQDAATETLVVSVNERQAASTRQVATGRGY